MRKVRNFFKRTVNFALVLSLLMSVLSVGAFADDTASDTNPVALSVSMNETRSYITITFDREIEAASTALYSRIRISKNGGSLATIPSTSKVTVSGDSLHIKLSSALTTKNNYFAIAAGAFVGQTDVIQTPVFDASDPKLIENGSVVLNSSNQTVTLKFDSEIDGYPNASSLKNGYIELARNGSTYNEVIPEEDITINSEDGEIVIYLSTWLSGKSSRFRIAEGKLQNTETGNINLSKITTVAIDATQTAAAPEIDYTTISTDRKTVTIYFTDKIKNSYSGVSNSVALSLLKSHIWLSRGGVDNYETLTASDSVSVGADNIKIVFDTPLSSSRNYIKIDTGSLTDYYGYTPCDTLVTDNITSGTSALKAPTYESAFLSNNNRIVIYFSAAVQKNPDITKSQLRENITISRNGSSYKALTSSDSVSFSDTKMTITLKEPLSGANNRVKIYANTISSTAGAVLTSTVTTGALEAGMSNDNYGEYYPKYDYITYDSNSQCVKIYFKNDIRTVSSVTLLSSIYISRNGGSYVALSSNDVATISPSNAITILLSEPLTGTSNSFKILSGTLADYDSGYILNSSLTTDSITASNSTTDSPSGTTSFSGDVIASLSDDFYSVTLKFDEAMYNNGDSLDDLKSKIQISRNGAFKTLTSDDYVRIDEQNHELLIVLSKPADEYFSQIRILSGALCDESNRAVSNTITTLPLGEAEGNARAYINDVAVENVVSLQVTGNSAIATISDMDKISSYSKKIELLIKIPADSTKATLNIPGSLVSQLSRYGSVVALSLDNATHFVPLSNITSISDGETLSLSIESASSQVSSNLSSAASKNTFKSETSAVKFSTKKTSTSGTQTDIILSVFSDKRFMLENPTTNQTSFSAVRIENSGAVVPVPSGSDTSGGVLYITAKTLKDGNYSVASASHSFVNTPTWVSTPANTLGSRLILSNATGSDLNANQPISRAETVSIMSKTLGIFGDMSGASPFFDMIATDSYFNAVMSSVAHKLISGYPDSTFKPSNNLTRAEAMTIVARAIRFMNGKSVSASSDMTLEQANAVLSKFTDAKTVDDWAKKDIAECVNAGVVNGDNNGRLNPKANVTRAELIQLMYNILTKADLL